MTEFKNIDKIFQQKLNNFEAKPSAKNWNAIASKLKKKKRNVIPLW